MMGFAALYPSYKSVAPGCHCERSEAIHLTTCGGMDCFALLAMTRGAVTSKDRVG
jgi:hypothetical protein